MIFRGTNREQQIPSGNDRQKGKNDVGLVDCALFKGNSLQG